MNIQLLSWFCNVLNEKILNTTCCWGCFFQFAKQKASELEDYQSLSLEGTDLEGEGEPAVKKRKLAKQVFINMSQIYIFFLTECQFFKNNYHI